MKGIGSLTIFYINLVIVYFFSYFARLFAKPLSIGSYFIMPNKFHAIVVLGCLVLISGLRSNIGDTTAYIYSYVRGDFSWEQVKQSKDFGFNVFQMFLKYFSNDPQILIFSTALITNVLIVSVLYKYSKLFELSLYVYITSGMFLVSMNGIRQFLAAAIIFAAFKYLIDGSWKKYILVVLFSATLHQSALILIPIYFIVRRKAWTLTTYLMLFFAILLTLGYNQFSGIIFSALEGTNYENYKDFSGGGANIIRVIVYAVPIILAYFGRVKLREIFPNSDYIVNMSLLGLVFMIISTQNWIYARFSLYFGLYPLILISWVVLLFNNRYQKLVYYAILICYFIYYYYENVITLRIIYKSNFFNI